MADEKKAVVANDKPAKKEKKDKKPGLFRRIGKFLKDCKGELKKIVWSSPKQTRNNTIFVIVVVVIFGAVIGLLDTAFSKAILALADLF